MKRDLLTSSVGITVVMNRQMIINLDTVVYITKTSLYMAEHRSTWRKQKWDNGSCKGK